MSQEPTVSPALARAAALAFDRISHREAVCRRIAAALLGAMADRRVGFADLEDKAGRGAGSFMDLFQRLVMGASSSPNDLELLADMVRAMDADIQFHISLEYPVDVE